MGVGPELAGHLELLIDIDRLGDLDSAVGLLRGVVQFAQRRVAGAGVIPGIAALSCGGVEAFHQRDRPVRLNHAQQRTQGRAHDSGTDQDDVGHVVVSHAHRLSRPAHPDPARPEIDTATRAAPAVMVGP